MTTIKQTLDLNHKMLTVISDDSSIWARVYFDTCKFTKDLIQLYTEDLTFRPDGTCYERTRYIGSFDRKNIEIISDKEAEE